MNFASLARGTSVFLDANTFVFHFQPHATFGPPCTALLKRIELQELVGYTSTHVLSEMAHRLMMIEARMSSSWSAGKLLQHLKQNPAAVQALTAHRTAVDEILQSRIQVLSIPPALLAATAALSQQHGLLTNDALIVALMQASGLTIIASNDDDWPA